MTRVADAAKAGRIAIGPDGVIYLTQRLDRLDAITVFAPDTSSGNANLVRTIAGPHTELASPSAIALDARGTIYVANYANQSVTIYPPSSSGNSAPIGKVSGSSTGLNGTVPEQSPA